MAYTVTVTSKQYRNCKCIPLTVYTSENSEEYCKCDGIHYIERSPPTS